MIFDVLNDDSASDDASDLVCDVGTDYACWDTCRWLLLKRSVLIDVSGNRQAVTPPSPGRPGGVVRVYGDGQADGAGTSTGLIPYCSISRAQLSYHGYKDAVKFFVAVPGTTFSNQVARSKFKLGTITFKAIYTSVSSCLPSEMHRHQPSRPLRPGTSTVLRWPHASLDFHRHSFAVWAPAVWNNIPAAVRDSVSLDTFKTAFKTYLFNCAYIPHH